MRSAKYEQDPLRFQGGVENLKEEVAVLEAQLAELEQKNLRSPVLPCPGRKERERRLQRGDRRVRRPG
jgi:hypothetical protein